MAGETAVKGLAHPDRRAVIRWATSAIVAIVILLING